jgi:hypothetical protein
MAIAQHRQVRREQDRAQAFWLVESGLDRAVAQLGRDAQFVGEEWRIDVPGASTARTGLVMIRVVHDAESTERRRLEIVAEFPAGAVHRTRLRREITWTAARPSTKTETAKNETNLPSAIAPENVVP